MMRILVLLFLAVQCFAKQHCQMLFYLQDAGETYGLLPVAETLRKEGAEVEILAGGTAKGIVAKSGVKFHALDQIGPLWQRTEKMEESELKKIAEEFEPEVFISGVAFALQGQFYQAFSSAKTVAFWDNFNAGGEDLYFQTAHGVEKEASNLWVSSKAVAESFKERESVFVAGQPSLEKWIEEASRVQKSEIRNKLQIAPKKIAVFVGGYGEPYEAAFALLLRSLETVSPDQLFVIVQPHPKFGGEIEEKILANRNSNRALPLRILHGEISTIEAVSSSDLVLCHQSTVGFQALFLGKSVIYLLPEGQTFSSIPLERGLAKRVESEKDFAAALKWAEATPSADFFALLGVPHDSVQKSCNKLRTMLKN